MSSQLNPLPVNHNPLRGSSFTKTIGGKRARECMDIETLESAPSAFDIATAIVTPELNNTPEINNSSWFEPFNQSASSDNYFSSSTANRTEATITTTIKDDTRSDFHATTTISSSDRYVSDNMNHQVLTPKISFPQSPRSRNAFDRNELIGQHINNSSHSSFSSSSSPSSGISSNDSRRRSPSSRKRGIFNSQQPSPAVACPKCGCNLERISNSSKTSNRRRTEADRQPVGIAAHTGQSFLGATSTGTSNSAFVRKAELSENKNLSGSAAGELGSWHFRSTSSNFNRSLITDEHEFGADEGDGADLGDLGEDELTELDDDHGNGLNHTQMNEDDSTVCLKLSSWRLRLEGDM
mmetsp:Transcript_35179/g.69056  ORF Transcript_35179/g.69056 Transcript_35179/m.69056 type:complete len:352 (+) Transcript_35179:234-1289(+)